MVESKLIENNIDLSTCIQKTICDYVQKGSAEIISGRAGSIQKIMDGILR